MAIFNNNLLAGAGAQSSDSTYKINQSIRFNAADSPELTKTYSGAGSRTTQTFSVWFKLGKTQSSSGFNFYNGGTGTSDTTWSGINIYNHKIYLQGYNTNWKVTTRLLRDHSAWYHLVYNWDTTNSIASERVRLYINGQRETDFSTDNNPGASASSGIGQAAKHSIGNQTRSVGYGYADAYFAEMHFLDGLAYGPEFFGETNDSGIWIPKEYTGSYGTNGFKIDGRDSSDLGDDESGNGNDFTASGLATHDQVSDSPTNNFPTFNSIYADNTGINDVTLANGNLQGTGTSGQFDHKTATFNLPKSGKWYFEYYLGGLYTGFGICKVGQEGSISSGYGFGNLSTSQGFGYQNDSIYNGSAVTTAFGLGNRSAGDILSVAVDVDNDKFYLGINNTYIAADGGADGNPSSGTNPTVTTSFSLSTNDIILGFYLSSSSSSVYLNFGQEGTFAGNKTAGGNSDANGIGNFLYSVPTGFKALCTKNLGS